MNHRRWTLGLACGLGLANVALASGGSVRPGNFNVLSVITTLNIPTGTNDRFIMRYGRTGIAAPNGSEFDPNSVICGARTNSGSQSTVSLLRPELLDIRLEDPNNVGFPEVTAVPSALATACFIQTPADPVCTLSTAIASDSNASPTECPSTVGYQFYSFRGGQGLRDPLKAFFVVWKVPAGQDTNTCWLAAERNAPLQGRSLFYNSVVTPPATAPSYGATGRSNWWLDAIVYTPPGLGLNFRMSGSAQIPGDRGRPCWAFRGEEGDGRGSSAINDDFMNTTIIIDNGTPASLPNQTLRLEADASVINPALPPRDLTGSFRLLSNPAKSLQSGNPYIWLPGRTVFRASIPARINPGTLQLKFPVNLPFTVSSRNTSLAPGTGPRNSKRQQLGLRKQRGQVDRGVSDIQLIVQGPAITGDVMAQRWTALRTFPSRSGPTGAKVVSLHVSSIQVAAVSVGTATGFDAIQLRKDDPVVLNSADQTDFGLVVRAGTANQGVGDGRVVPGIPVDPNGATAFFTYPVSGNVLSADGSFWVGVYPEHGDVGGAGANGTFLGLDEVGDTIIGESFTGDAFTQPYDPLNPAGNWLIRVIFTASNPFTGEEEQAPVVNPPVISNNPGHYGYANKIPTDVELSPER